MPDRGMKVALLSYDFAEYCVRLASALARDAEVRLLLPSETTRHHLWRVNPAVQLRLFGKPRLRQPVRQLQTNYTILQEISRFDPDVIHLQQGHMWFNFALPLLRRYPLVLTVHDPQHHLGDRDVQRTPQWVMDLGFRHASQLIVHGQRLKRVVVDRLRVPAEGVHVIPTVVRGDDRAFHQIQEEENQILFFGRIWGYKGLEYLIRAEPLITARVPEARIVIAGQGEDFDRYRRMMAHPERFQVHNQHIPDHRVAEFFRRASVVVLPYVDASQSAVIAHAYTFSKPVVSTNVGGLPDLVDHGRTGLLVPPR
ncbi:MAG: glycosyltransferase family 4 protein, partial [Chloroflexota bacterium]